MIRIQNNITAGSSEPTLTATRTPIPAFLHGLAPESLGVLSWSDPQLGVQDCKWWPEVDQSPALNEYERYGDETLTVGDGVVVVARAVVAFTAEEIQAHNAEIAQRVMQEITDAAQGRLDAWARARNYDGILSLCTYATSSVPKFAAEGQRGVDNRDATWSTLQGILSAVVDGTRPVPSGYAEIEPELPALVWPE
jgi:hypothetical protein